MVLVRCDEEERQGQQRTLQDIIMKPQHQFSMEVVYCALHLVTLIGMELHHDEPYNNQVPPCLMQYPLEKIYGNWWLHLFFDHNNI